MRPLQIHFAPGQLRIAFANRRPIRIVQCRIAAALRQKNRNSASAPR